ncbi:uncharacterized mitochondrial protein AtMg00810-like [Lathyrus oleraceus]|uniref:uncharacterized mitochondrial protein AtMg00810-like n=1 Tax=Pisum sativum TaxID=3888 RepID=UPI0021D0A4FA|nr:uncharacterized mitochondrial protein AtMg00810-like [Pisum sativum]
METLKKSMACIQKDNNENEEPSCFGCETCHIWKKEVNTLQAKLDKALQPKITLAIDPSNLKRSLNLSYKKGVELLPWSSNQATQQRDIHVSKKTLQGIANEIWYEDAKLIDTPIPINGNLEKDENGKDFDVKKYRGMIGSLLYLTTSRSDIMFSVCICARYQSSPKESHLKAVKHILRYLHGTSKYGIWYSKGSDYSLVGYADSGFAGCKSDRKSTS